MKIVYRDPTPFEKGWRPPEGYDEDKLFYDQSAYADYRAFEGFDFSSAHYRIWDDQDRLEQVQAQVGNFGPLLGALAVKRLLSIGSGRPFWEVLLVSQVPNLQIVASDIHPPMNVVEDLKRAADYGFPLAATNVSYTRFDVRDAAASRSVLSETQFDAIFICACFFVCSDEVWSDFLRQASSYGVKHVIVLHAEDIAPINVARYRLCGGPKRGVFAGYLRSQQAVREVFDAAGMRCVATYVPPQGNDFVHRTLARLRLHYSRRGYVFTNDSSIRNLEPQLKLAMRRAV